MPPIAGALAAVAIAGCGEQLGAADAVRYAAELEPLNDSGVTGSATLSREGEHLTVRIRADDLAPHHVHGQAIHGFAGERRPAECPAEELGAVRVEAKEGEREYGPRLRKLEPFPSADRRGRIDYELTFNIDPDQLEPLDTRAIVLKGATEGGDRDRYLPDLPVACGQIRSVGRAGT